jgi:hypothetical protein
MLLACISIDGSYNVPAIITAKAPVPEPSTLLLTGMAGVFGFGQAWRRRKLAASDN